MNHRMHPLAAALALAFSATAAVAAETNTQTLSDIVVNASRPAALPEAGEVAPLDLAAQRAATSDTASLLKEVPGVFVQGAGGVSSLPSVRGLADDRLRIRVDGMDLISACGNHMNPALSYIDPTNVEQVKVYSGIVPVSAGGDSLGASIVVNSPAPRFAQPGEGLLSSGEIGAFYRSNGDAWGAHATASIANENLSIRYSGSTAESGNYSAAKAFKPTTQAVGTTPGNHTIAGDEVGSSAYKTENHQIAAAYRLDNHLFDLRIGYQHIPYQGFPNQHMDMTDNESTQVNLGYTGKFAWGKLEARVYHEETNHEMDFASDKLYWYRAPNTPCSPAGPTCVQGMPMHTQGKNTGALVKADIVLNPRDLVRVGGEYQSYRLNDWWPPSGGGMWPDAFINIKDGERNRYDVFGEWEASWTTQWQTLFGVRSSTVQMDAGKVAGYNAGYTTDANNFSNADRSRTDNNIDLSALARYTPDAGQTYEGGYSRKTRSPNLYERYTWSNGMMAMTMNNWVNDGNGYVGNLDLKPEVAHTLSVSADWHDASRRQWGFRVSPYFSYVEDYIDAVPHKTIAWVPGKYNYLGLANQDARIYGIDLNAFASLGSLAGIGDFAVRGAVAYAHGRNQETGDALYNVMPLNARFVLEHRLGQWTSAVEEQLVAAKDDVSEVRNEKGTPGYSLLNLRSSYETKNFRIDIGIDNALDKQYYLPLGGAYIGQGRTMSLGNSTSWSATGTTQPPYGYTIPGMGRSLYIGLNVKY